MEARVVEGQDQAIALHQAILGAHEEAQRCDPASPLPYPSVEQMRRGADPEHPHLRLYVTYSDELDGDTALKAGVLPTPPEPMLVALVTAEGQIGWLCHVAPVQDCVASGAFTMLADRIHADCGACFGEVRNPEVLAALARGPGAVVEGELIRYEPE